VELERLYGFLRESPRDARWMMRRVGSNYREVVEELRHRGWPVAVRFEVVAGAHRAVYEAVDQAELFDGLPVAPSKRRRRSRQGKPEDKEAGEE